jgi:hypothetical protein
LRENNYNTGLRGVLFDAEHYARMGPAVWLYGWLILRQTHQTGTIGWVLGGAPIHYREIEEETGFNRRTLERWMKMLRRQKYIETAVVDSGITIRILRAKKHLHRNKETSVVRGIAGGVRGAAEGVPRKCVASGSEKYLNQRVTNGIGSSSVVRIKEREASAIHQAVESEENSATESWRTEVRQQTVPQETKTPGQERIIQNSLPEENHGQSNDPQAASASPVYPAQTQTHKQRPLYRGNDHPSAQQNFSWELRERMRFIRAERDDAVRRELAVGSGPEVRRQ